MGEADLSVSGRRVLRYLVTFCLAESMMSSNSDICRRRHGYRLRQQLTGGQSRDS